MPRRYAPKKFNQNLVIKITFFLLLSLPLIVFGLIKNSFDIRNKAFDELELSEQNPCIISVPNVNPYSLEVGQTVRVTVDARLTNAGIESIQITDSSGRNIYTESYDTAPTDIGTTFEFTPSKSGMIDMLGVVRKVGGGSVGCKISSSYDIKGLRAVQNNSSPEFKSDPSQSKPSQDIKTGTQYEYVLTADDVDGDRINYSYSFTPKADWLSKSVIEDGSNGKLTLVFKGSSNKPASYLANVVIHDGYSKHVRSQSWIISVSPATNDIPIVKIIQPAESLRLDLGSSFKTSWQAADLNHIVKYQLFMAPNPTDESTWLTIENAIPYNMNSYNVHTSNIPAGTYNLIIKATDNQKPANTGMGISPEIVLSRGDGSKDATTDDEVFLGEPQVTNMSPSNADKITNKRVTVKATIIASIKSKINESSIIFKIDDIDVTKSVKINKISNGEYTLIYQPEENFKAGQHKAEIFFQDSSSKSTTKSWTFNISSEEDENSGVITILGFQIPKRTLIIILIGIFIIAAAILAPFLISSIWKEDHKTKEKSVYVSNRHLPSSLPSKGMYGTNVEVNHEVKSMVDKEPEEEEKKAEKEVWDKYSAPKPEPEQTEENKKDSKEEQSIEQTFHITEEIPEEKIDSQVKEEFSPILEKEEEKNVEDKTTTTTYKEEVTPIFSPEVEINSEEQAISDTSVDQQIEEEVKPEEKDISTFKPESEIKSEEEETLISSTKENQNEEQVTSVFQPETDELEKYEVPIPQEPEQVTEDQQETSATTTLQTDTTHMEVPIAQEPESATQSQEDTSTSTPQLADTIPIETPISQEPVPIKQDQTETSATIPQLDTTVIPEPEVPDASDLQQIFEQIQQTEK
ncbi:MAG: hypothetical protein ACOX6Q_02340 [Candidatus Dojkabacteria bacterium]|jgi:hypothetical protein